MNALSALVWAEALLVVVCVAFGLSSRLGSAGETARVTHLVLAVFVAAGMLVVAIGISGALR